MFLCESCQVCVDRSVEFGGQRGKMVVVFACGVHGMNRVGVRSVREEDRHHRQVLVTVELKLALFHRAANPNGAVTRTRK